MAWVENGPSRKILYRTFPKAVAAGVRLQYKQAEFIQSLGEELIRMSISVLFAIHTNR